MCSKVKDFLTDDDFINYAHIASFLSVYIDRTLLLCVNA